MTALAQYLKNRYFGEDHPYRTFETEVERLLRPEHTLLDAGCGRTAPILAKYRGKAARLIGVDVVEFDPVLRGLELYRADLKAVPLDSGCVDVIMARSVMEHVTEPALVFAEMYRLLKPGGRFVFLTANLWDYASLVAKAIPNRFHPWLVARTEGRDEIDVFPVAYKTNTRGAIARWSKHAGLQVVSFDYLGQYPSYLMFNGFLFLLATGYEKLIAKAKALAFLRGWILATLRKPLDSGSSGSAVSRHPRAQPPEISR